MIASLDVATMMSSKVGSVTACMIAAGIVPYYQPVLAFGEKEQVIVHDGQIYEPCEDRVYTSMYSIDSVYSIKENAAVANCTMSKTLTCEDRDLMHMKLIQELALGNILMFEIANSEDDILTFNVYGRDIEGIEKVLDYLHRSIPQAIEDMDADLKDGNSFKFHGNDNMWMAYIDACNGSYYASDTDWETMDVDSVHTDVTMTSPSITSDYYVPRPYARILHVKDASFSTNQVRGQGTFMQMQSQELKPDCVIYVMHDNLWYAIGCHTSMIGGHMAVLKYKDYEEEVTIFLSKESYYCNTTTMFRNACPEKDKKEFKRIDDEAREKGKARDSQGKAFRANKSDKLKGVVTNSINRHRKSKA